MLPTDVSKRHSELHLLDVREQDEWDAGHIDGAQHIPLGELAARMGEVPRDRTVVAVCRSGSRSDRAARGLRAAGFAAENLDGGVTAWSRAGLPLVGQTGGPGRVIQGGRARDRLATLPDAGGALRTGGTPRRRGARRRAGRPPQDDGGKGARPHGRGRAQRPPRGARSRGDLRDRVAHPTRALLRLRASRRALRRDRPRGRLDVRPRLREVTAHRPEPRRLGSRDRLPRTSGLGPRLDLRHTAPARARFRRGGGLTARPLRTPDTWTKRSRAPKTHPKRPKRRAKASRNASPRYSIPTRPAWARAKRCSSRRPRRSDSSRDADTTGAR